MLSLRTTPSCVTRRVSATRSAIVRPRVSVRSTPKDIEVQLEAAMKAANECKEDCAASWDTVEELSAAKSHMKDAAKADPSKSDPLEIFCKDNADADECRVYED